MKTIKARVEKLEAAYHQPRTLEEELAAMPDEELHRRILEFDPDYFKRSPEENEQRLLELKKQIEAEGKWPL